MKKQCNFKIEEICNGYLVKFQYRFEEEISYYKTIEEVNDFVLGMITLFDNDEKSFPQDILKQHEKFLSNQHKKLLEQQSHKYKK